MYLTWSLLPMHWQRLQIKSYSWLSKPVFPHTLAESKLFLPLVFTKILLSPKGVSKNIILTSKGNKECLKSQVYCPRLHFGHQLTCDFEHSLLYRPRDVKYCYMQRRKRLCNIFQWGWEKNFDQQKNCFYALFMIYT